MKRIFVLLISTVLFMNCIFCGCGNQSAANPSNADGSATDKPAEVPAEKSILSVYLVDTDALYADAVSSFQKQSQTVTLDVTSFTTYDAMLRAADEAAATGEEPDVLLYNSNSMKGEVDGYTLAKSGKFLPLDSFLEQLDPAIYPKVLMDAGKVAGAQYFIPFSYNLLYAYTSQRLMTIKGYSPSDNLYHMLMNESESLMEVSHKAPISMQIYRPDPVNAFLDAAGVRLFDKNTGEVIADKAELEEICRFAKIVYDNMEKTAALNQKFANDFAGGTASFSFHTESYPFMNTIRYYHSMFPAGTGSPMVAMPYHKLNDPQALCASIVCFGGVNVNTKSPEKAFDLLKYILDYPVSNNWKRGQATYEYHAPVNRSVYQTAVEELSTTGGIGPVEITPLSKSIAEQLMANTDKITNAIIPNTTLGIRLEAALTPYFMEQDSFDSCYDAALQELQIYLNE